MQKIKQHSLTKRIRVTNVLTKQETEFDSMKAVESFTGISVYMLHKLTTNEAIKTDEYIRSPKTNVLYHIEFIFDYVVSARSEFQDQEPISFTSVHKCCTFFGISKFTYYERAKISKVGIECPKPIVDKCDTKWYLTFLKPIDGVFHGNNGSNRTNNN